MWIQTYGGGVFDYTKPEEAKLTFESLVHPLSHIPRFLGHTSRFYSVAQHSIHVSSIIEDPHDALCGLFHDAHEAFIGDMPRPLQVAFPEARKVEAKIRTAIRKSLGLPEIMSDAVEDADEILLVNEAHQLLGAQPVDNWTKQYDVKAFYSIPEWSIEEVRTRFRQRMYELLRMLIWQPEQIRQLHLGREAQS